MNDINDTNGFSSQIYTIVPQKDKVNKTRNTNITEELGKYINNFLYKLYEKNKDVVTSITPEITKNDIEIFRKKEINKSIKDKYKFYCTKFPSCPSYKPITWLRFECLLLSVFSYFLDVIFEDKTIEDSKSKKEYLLDKATSTIIGLDFQIKELKEFENFFNWLKNINNLGEKILLEKPEGEAVDKFLEDESIIGFVTETIDNKVHKKILCLKKFAFEMILSEHKIDKKRFLEYMDYNQKVKPNVDERGKRHDVKIPFKKYPKQKRLYRFYIS